MNRATRTATLGAAVTLALSAAAMAYQTDSEYPAGYTDGTTYYDYAQVTGVSPVSESVRIETPRRECWTENVTRYQSAPARRSWTPEILGGIVGAAVGNQFGSGSGRDIATVAGAALGASVGHDIKGRRAAAGGYSYSEPVERCREVNSSHVENRIVGYDVRYRYDNRTYTTRLPYQPGDRIRVQVSVSPADN